MKTFRYVSGRSTSRALLGMFLAMMLAAPAIGQVTGISYTLTPAFGRVYFDKNAGLQDGSFAGALLGFGFGDYAELTGLYAQSLDAKTDFSSFADLGSELHDRFDLLPSRDVSVRQYGANLKFNLGRSTFFPFVSVGTGILRFDPDLLDESRVIYLTGTAGFQFGVGERLALILQVEDLVYRYNPASVLLSDNDLGDLSLSAGDFRQVNVNNFGVRAGLQLYVGGRTRGELSEVDLALRDQFAHGLSGIRLEVEPIGGRIDFHEDLGYRDRQRMAGVFAGFELGPYLGLRGFFWRGVKDGAITDFDNLQAYGGEIKLKFGSFAGVRPHILLGGGYLDVLGGYDGNGMAEAVDRPFASGGGGLTLPLGRAVQLHAGVRALAMSTENAEDVSEPSEIVANAFYHAGISFGLGGGSSRVGPERPRRVSGSMEAELARVSRQVDSLAVLLNETRRLTYDRSLIDTGQEPRSITIPLPPRGELTVRYGEPATGAAPGVVYVNPETGRLIGEEVAEPADQPLTAGEIEAIVRSVREEELRARERTAPSELERRLLDRIAELERRLDMVPAGRTVAAPATRDEAATTERSQHNLAATTERTRYTLAAVFPFIGFGLSNDQLGLAGVRADFRSSALVGARFLPELVVAAGEDGIWYGLNADVAFPLGIEIASLRPYGGMGLGLNTGGGSELVFNLLAGVERNGLQGRFFAEYMSQDFFDLNRFILGYRVSF